MSRMNAALAAALLMLLVSPATSMAATPSGGIVVSDADEVWEAVPASDAGLLVALDGVGARTTVEFANEIVQIVLESTPAGLQSLLDEASARVRVSYANAVLHQMLTVAPTALRSRLDDVDERIVFAFADDNREFALAQPPWLVAEDEEAPQITQITAWGNGTITWTTNEPADSRVDYGTQPGNYTETESEPGFVTEHEVALVGLQRGVRYYYQVSSSDQSGNAATSAEHSFLLLPPTYMPMVVR